MDLFEQIRRREEEKCKQQEAKVQQLKQKLDEADKRFFNEKEEFDIKNRNLLTFKPSELKTVFTDFDDIVVTPPSPKKDEEAPEDDLDEDKKHEREAFFHELMTSKKPMLQRKKVNPTTLDITKEESIAKYIAAEAANGDSDGHINATI